jgi:hypothetical protein
MPKPIRQSTHTRTSRVRRLVRRALRAGLWAAVLVSFTTASLGIPLRWAPDGRADDAPADGSGTFVPALRVTAGLRAGPCTTPETAGCGCSAQLQRSHRCCCARPRIAEQPKTCCSDSQASRHVHSKPPRPADAPSAPIVHCPCGQSDFTWTVASVQPRLPCRPASLVDGSSHSVLLQAARVRRPFHSLTPPTPPPKSPVC